MKKLDSSSPFCSIRRAIAFAAIFASAICFVGEPRIWGQTRQPSAPNAAPHALSPQEIARRTMPSVVLIICDDGEKEIQGSGFFVRQGLVVTNYHVVEGMTRGVVKVRGKAAQLITEIVAVDKASDLAILR